MSTLRITAYVDGFNLYYGVFRAKTPKFRTCRQFKWLNIVTFLQKSCQSAGVPGTLTKVRYFSATSLPNVNDPQQTQRQQALFSALRTLPEVEIILGQHRERQKRGQLLGQTHPIRTFVAREEKGSDVNLAAYLIRDAALNEMDTAVVVSNDTDLTLAASMVRDDFHKSVIVISPQLDSPKIAYQLQ